MQRLEEQDTEGLCSPAPTLPLGRPPPAQPSPTLAVLSCRDQCVDVIVVPILVIAAALGHTLHLVLAKVGLAAWALGVATWGGVGVTGPEALLGQG